MQTQQPWQVAASVAFAPQLVRLAKRTWFRTPPQERHVHSPEDVVQELRAGVFAAARKNAPSHPGYFWVAAVNRSRDLLRQARRRVEFFPEWVVRPADFDPTPALESRDCLRYLENAMSPRERSVLERLAVESVSTSGAGKRSTAHYQGTRVRERARFLLGKELSK